MKCTFLGTLCFVSLLALGVFYIRPAIGGFIYEFDIPNKGHVPAPRGADLGLDYQDPETGMTFVRVTGGCFSRRPGQNAYSYEACVDDFYIGKYEVTQAEWQSVMGYNPAHFKGTTRPVEQVSWEDAQALINQMNSPGGKIYRLPTEAEWEYAARSSGQDDVFPGIHRDEMDEKFRKGLSFRTSDLNKFSWYSGNSGGWGKENQTHNVGLKKPNELGLFDMAGNVWEWCSDWYEAGFYESSSKENPQGPETGALRSARGGGWDSAWNEVAISYRTGFHPGFRFKNVGLRLVLTPH